VAALGAGLSLRATKLTAARLTQALRQIVGNAALAARCRAVAGHFAADPPLSSLCARIEALAASAQGDTVK
jgi:UDP:flavonoid glycosyltransferase YjiC (YdhE family)